MTLPLIIDASVLLPDHLHCIWTLPPGDGNFPARWAIIKRHVSRECRGMIEVPPGLSRKRRNEHGFRQRRFWEHQVRDSDDLARHLDYIHWNPVKHGLVRSAKDWPYSSFHRYAEGRYYPGNWGGVQTDEASSGFGE